jgi:hypothetical protein
MNMKTAFEASAPWLRILAEGVERWAIPWRCAHEFLAIVTSPKILKPPDTGIRSDEGFADMV